MQQNCKGKKTINYKYNRRSWHTNQSIVNCQVKRISREVKERRKLRNWRFTVIEKVWRRVEKCITKVKCLKRKKTKVQKWHPSTTASWTLGECKFFLFDLNWIFEKLVLVHISRKISFCAVNNTLSRQKHDFGELKF